MGGIQRHLPAWSRGRVGRAGFAGAMGDFATGIGIPVAADRALALVGVPRKESCSKAGGADPLNNCLGPRGHFYDWG